MSSRAPDNWTLPQDLNDPCFDREFAVPDDETERADATRLLRLGARHSIQRMGFAINFFCRQSFMSGLNEDYERHRLHPILLQRYHPNVGYYMKVIAIARHHHSVFHQIFHHQGLYRAVKFSVSYRRHIPTLVKRSYPGVSKGQLETLDNLLELVPLRLPFPKLSIRMLFRRSANEDGPRDSVQQVVDEVASGKRKSDEPDHPPKRMCQDTHMMPESEAQPSEGQGELMDNVVGDFSLICLSYTSFPVVFPIADLRKWQLEAAQVAYKAALAAGSDGFDAKQSPIAAAIAYVESVAAGIVKSTEKVEDPTAGKNNITDEANEENGPPMSILERLLRSDSPEDEEEAGKLKPKPVTDTPPDENNKQVQNLPAQNSQSQPVNNQEAQLPNTQSQPAAHTLHIQIQEPTPRATPVRKAVRRVTPKKPPATPKETAKAPTKRRASQAKNQPSTTPPEAVAQQPALTGIAALAQHYQQMEAKRMHYAMTQNQANTNQQCTTGWGSDPYSQQQGVNWMSYNQQAYPTEPATKSDQYSQSTVAPNQYSQPAVASDQYSQATVASQQYSQQNYDNYYSPQDQQLDWRNLVATFPPPNYAESTGNTENSTAQQDFYANSNNWDYSGQQWTYDNQYPFNNQYDQSLQSQGQENMNYTQNSGFESTQNYGLNQQYDVTTQNTNAQHEQVQPIPFQDHNFQSAPTFNLQPNFDDQFPFASQQKTAHPVANQTDVPYDPTYNRPRNPVPDQLEAAAAQQSAPFQPQSQENFTSVPFSASPRLGMVTPEPLPTAPVSCVRDPYTTAPAHATTVSDRVFTAHAPPAYGTITDRYTSSLKRDTRHSVAPAMKTPPPISYTTAPVSNTPFRMAPAPTAPPINSAISTPDPPATARVAVVHPLQLQQPPQQQQAAKSQPQKQVEDQPLVLQPQQDGSIAAAQPNLPFEDDSPPPSPEYVDPLAPWNELDDPGYHTIIFPKYVQKPLEVAYANREFNNIEDVKRIATKNGSNSDCFLNVYRWYRSRRTDDYCAGDALITERARRYARALEDKRIEQRTIALANR